LRLPFRVPSRLHLAADGPPLLFGDPWPGPDVRVGCRRQATIALEEDQPPAPSGAQHPPRPIPAETHSRRTDRTDDHSPPRGRPHAPTLARRLRRRARLRGVAGPRRGPLAAAEIYSCGLVKARGPTGSVAARRAVETGEPVIVSHRAATTFVAGG